MFGHDTCVVGVSSLTCPARRARNFLAVAIRQCVEATFLVMSDGRVILLLLIGQRVENPCARRPCRSAGSATDQPTTCRVGSTVMSHGWTRRGHSGAQDSSTATMSGSIGAFLQRRHVWMDEVRQGLDRAYFSTFRAQAERVGLVGALAEVQREGHDIAYTRTLEVLWEKEDAQTEAGAAVGGPCCDGLFSVSPCATPSPRPPPRCTKSVKDDVLHFEVSVLQQRLRAQMVRTLLDGQARDIPTPSSHTSCSRRSFLFDRNGQTRMLARVLEPEMLRRLPKLVV